MEGYMRTAAAILVTFIVGIGVGNWMTAPPQTASAQAVPSTGGFAAVPGAIGSQDLTGPYEVVKGWPKDISTVPGLSLIHISEPTRLLSISYAVFCLKKK